MDSNVNKSLWQTFGLLDSREAQTSDIYGDWGPSWKMIIGAKEAYISMNYSGPPLKTTPRRQKTE